MIIYKGNISKYFSQSEYHPGSATVYMTEATITFIVCLRQFRKWLNQPMYVVSWYRTRDENMKIGGINSSNHLTGTAIDWHLRNHDISTDEFKRYARKWAAICKANRCVGEMGIYKWGLHMGMQNPDQAKLNGHKFYHWDSRSGQQVNLPFKDLYNI